MSSSIDGASQRVSRKVDPSIFQELGIEHKKNLHEQFG